MKYTYKIGMLIDGMDATMFFLINHDEKLSRKVDVLLIAKDRVRDNPWIPSFSKHDKNYRNPEMIRTDRIISFFLLGELNE